MTIPNDYDFSGWITKYGIRCTDGTIIQHDVFSLPHDGTLKKFPLVANHTYGTPETFVGHILAEPREEGVYGYGYLLDTPEALDIKQGIKSGEYGQMSIGARVKNRVNNLIEKAKLMEVSLVKHGANAGAVIEHVLQHDAEGEEMIYYQTGEDGAILTHSAAVQTVEEVIGTVDADDYNDLVDALEAGDEDAINAIFDELSDDQLRAVLALVYADNEEVDDVLEIPIDQITDEVVLDITGLNTEETEEDDAEESEVEETEEDDAEESEVEETEEDDAEESEVEETETIEHGDVMKDNQFDAQTAAVEAQTELNELIKHSAAANFGTLKQAAIQVDGLGKEDDIIQHGITNIDNILPEPNATGGVRWYDPSALNVEQILNKVSVMPTSTITNVFGDLTEEDARARGYIAGNEKLDSKTVTLYNRVTTPQMVIRRDTIDRQHLLLIKERGLVGVQFVQDIQLSKLKQEVVRAMILGDGREAVVGGKPNPDKIDEGHIRPIFTDDDFFTIKVNSANFQSVVDDVRKALPAYQGSGQAALIINPFDLAKLAVLKDNNGRYLFGASADSNATPTNMDIARYFGCSEVIEYRVMPQGKFLIGNIRDYVMGQNGEQKTTMFDDFDIDFNQEKYLVETMLSGAIIQPKSFIAVTVADTSAIAENLEFSAKALKSSNRYTDTGVNVKIDGENAKGKISSDNTAASKSSTSSKATTGK